MLFKNWRPEMGLPSVRPEYWSNAEWAKAVALRPERYATPRWVDVLVGAINTRRSRRGGSEDGVGYLPRRL
jgi:hypothetical protein